MEKPSQNPPPEKPTTAPPVKPGTTARPWRPEVIPGRKPIYVGEIELTIS